MDLAATHGSGSKAFIQFVSGALGGAVTTLTLFPLDTIKTKMQMYPTTYPGPLSCLREVATKKGLLSLYRGLTPALAASVAECSFEFMVFGGCQDIIRHMYGIDRKLPLSVIQEGQAGALAGASTALFLSPLELLKIRLQLDPQLTAVAHNDDNLEKKLSRRTALALTVDVIRRQGILGLYAGFSLTLLRNIPGNCVFFASYYGAQNKMMEVFSKEHIDPLTTVVSGAVAGTMFWLSVYPIDVLKTRFQMMAVNATYPSVWSIAFSMIKHEGIGSLFNGLQVTIGKTCIVASLFFLVFEETKSFLGYFWL